MAPHHPYYPLDVQLPGYVPMTVDFDYILGVFFASVALVSGLTWKLSGRRKHLATTERLIAAWLATTGVIHFVIEGWVVVKADFWKDASNNYLSQTWKEYSKADSRYATRDAFIVAMEAVTAFAWGPLCWVAVAGIFSAAAWRYSLMMIVSLGQIYGDVLYYVTCYLEGFVHSRPEALYFWFYFVVINSFWIIIPALVIVHAWGKVSAAVGAGGALPPRRGSAAAAGAPPTPAGPTTRRRAAAAATGKQE
eukprot:scaffold18.g1896.t1